MRGEGDPDGISDTMWTRKASVALLRTVALLVAGIATADNGEGVPPEEIRVTLPGGATMKMMWIPAGTFTMGSLWSEPGRYRDEVPHEVTITSGFYMGKYELTQGQWSSVMRTRPWSGSGLVRDHPDHPAVMISWDDVQVLIRRLNEAEGMEAYRVPAEAEWEYACRAGTMTRWSFQDDPSLLGEHAWYRSTAWNVGEKYAHEVGTKQPNLWGLFDMHGNVWEWCQDWYDADYYSVSPPVDPPGPLSGSGRVKRGGSFHNRAQVLRSAYRDLNSPVHRSYDVGVRLVKVVPPRPVSVPEGTWGEIKKEWRGDPR